MRRATVRCQHTYNSFFRRGTGHANINSACNSSRTRTTSSISISTAVALPRNSCSIHIGSSIPEYVKQPYIPDQTGIAVRILACHLLWWEGPIRRDGHLHLEVVVQYALPLLSPHLGSTTILQEGQQHLSNVNITAVQVQDELEGSGVTSTSPITLCVMSPSANHCAKSSSPYQCVTSACPESVTSASPSQCVASSSSGACRWFRERVTPNPRASYSSWLQLKPRYTRICPFSGYT